MRPSRKKSRAASVAAPKTAPRFKSKNKPLSKVVLAAKQVHELVEECHDDLANVNAKMQRELNAAPLPSKRAKILKQSLAVQAKIEQVSDKVESITDELVEHARERRLLDSQFAAAVQQEAAARHAALHDSLTGLANRSLWEDRIEHGLAQAKRHGWGMAVMFIDLDGFKHINDTLGHAVGDQVLVSVAKRLCENSRSDDTVARYGGDEFVCLMLEISSEKDALGIARCMLENLQLPYELVLGDVMEQHVVLASVGIALYPQHGETAELLLSAADAAMYQAKCSKSGYAFASEVEPNA